MYRYLLLLIPLFLLNCNSNVAEKKLTTTVIPFVPPIDNNTISYDNNEAGYLNVKFQVAGRCFAYSSEKNWLAKNGEWHSNNYAKPDAKAYDENGLFMLIDTSKIILIDSVFKAHKLIVGNNDNKKHTFLGSDSRLSIVPQAIDENGNWQDIGFLRRSSCGNSYHDVILDKNEYWYFWQPIFNGDFTTKLRYKFEIENNKFIYSNEVNAKVNLEQFNPDLKEGYVNQGLMDPYFG
jgi:hypothetical protein